MVERHFPYKFSTFYDIAFKRNKYGEYIDPELAQMAEELKIKLQMDGTGFGNYKGGYVMLCKGCNKLFTSYIYRYHFCNQGCRVKYFRKKNFGRHADFINKHYHFDQ